MESLEEAEDGHEERPVVASCEEGVIEGFCLRCMHTGEDCVRSWQCRISPVTAGMDACSLGAVACTYLPR